VGDIQLRESETDANRYILVQPTMLAVSSTRQEQASPCGLSQQLRRVLLELRESAAL